MCRYIGEPDGFPGNGFAEPGSFHKTYERQLPKTSLGGSVQPNDSQINIQAAKDFRKEVSPLAVGNIFKEHARSQLGWIANEIPEFVKKSIEVCWLMCAQEPPVVIGSEAAVSDTFDGNVYKAYTNSGTVVSYNVWLPLLLHKDGPLLVKGIVQPIKVLPVVAEKLRGDLPGETYHSPYSQTSTEDRASPLHLASQSNYRSRPNT